MSIDLGGSLIKLCVFVPKNFTPLSIRPEWLNYYSEKKTFTLCKLTGTFYLFKFQNAQLNSLFAFIKAHHLNEHCRTFFLTGGGSVKHAQRFKTELGVDLKQVDEIRSMIRGHTFMLQNLYNEAFSFDVNKATEENPELGFTYYNEDKTKVTYPYLLLVIGSGCGFIKVNSPKDYQRIGGSALGGGTFAGLTRFLTGETNFDRMINMATVGDSSKVNLTVGDIYGSDYDAMSLPSDLIASYFCKGINPDYPQPAPEDLANATLKMVSINIAQLAYLAGKTHGIRNYYIGGSFTRRNPATMAAISFGMKHVSKGEAQATFLSHEGWLGSVGAMLESLEFHALSFQPETIYDRLDDWKNTLYSKLINLSGMWLKKPIPVNNGPMDLEKLDAVIRRLNSSEFMSAVTPAIKKTQSYNDLVALLCPACDCKKCAAERELSQ